jgi:UDPglucose 6-dehydrogenase
MQIAIIGAGWVGVVTAAAFADLGHTVWCADLNATRIQQLNHGEAPFFEPGLSDLLTRALASGRLYFTDDNQKAMETAEVVFCCVNTPTGEDGVTDLSAVRAVAQDFSQHHLAGAVFVIKSTVPAGTAEKVRQLIGGDAVIASNPEFLAESTAIRDTLTPSRVVIGADETATIEIVKRVYEPIIASGAPVFTCDCATAEVIKTASNSFLATRISFINEIANYCNTVGADPMGVAQGMGLDPRIGNVRPGVGYGGGCFPKDVKALLQEGSRVDSPLTVLQATHEANYRQRTLLFDRIRQALGDVAGKRIAVLGLAFKPKTDDVRDAPALTLIEALLDAGATVAAYDPQVKSLPQQFASNITFAPDALTCASTADAVVLMCEWPEFQDLDLNVLKAQMSGSVLVDGRYMWSRKNAEALGFIYVA